MKLLKIAIIAICCVFLTGTAAGYTIAFTVTPAETMAGGVVTITGTSTIPAGYTDEAILYRQVPNYLPKEAGRYPFTITEGGAWGFAIDTTGFSPATYKIQLPKSGEYPYGSSAVLMRTFTVSAPPETSSRPTTTETPVPTAVVTPEETATIIPPTPTTSPAGAMTTITAAGISALAFTYALRKKTE